MAANALDIRMARLEGAYEQINARLGVIEADIREVRSDLGQKIDTMFRWVVGFILANWITIILTIVLHSK